MKRSGIARRAPLVTRTAINRVSSRQARKNRKLGKVLKALHGTPCVVRWNDDCTGRAQQGDHILSRARGGTNDPSNLRGACVHCHQMLTTNPAEAERRGLTFHGWGAVS